MKKQIMTALLILTAGLAAAPVFSADLAPAKLQAALIIKLLPYYTNIGSKAITIHVVGADEVAKELKASIGKAIGKGSLAKVTTGDTLDASASVVYIGKNPAAHITWTQEHKVLSITGDPNLVAEGVTLGIALEASKPKIFLNLTSSKAEGADWNPAILKVAETLS